MSAVGNARTLLDNLMRDGAFVSWTERETDFGTQFIVVGNDGRQHYYRPRHIQAFWAGWCSRGARERAQ